jgi:hypothetical protein
MNRFETFAYEINLRRYNKAERDGFEHVDDFRAAPMGVDGAGCRYWFHDNVRGTGPRLYREGPATFHKFKRPNSEAAAAAAAEAAAVGMASPGGAGSQALKSVVRRPPHYNPDMDTDDDDPPCMECGGMEDEDSFVLCDGCPNGGHFYCMGIKKIPKGNWECVVCVGGKKAVVAAAAAQAAAAAAMKSATAVRRPPHYAPDMDSDDDDPPCMECGGMEDADSFVLCDGCPNGGHFYCMDMKKVPKVGRCRLFSTPI